MQAKCCSTLGLLKHVSPSLPPLLLSPRRYRSLSMVPPLSITDPRYLKWSTLFRFFSIQFHWQRVFLVDRCSVFATLIVRPLSVKTYCHDSSLLWVSVLVMSIIAKSSAYSSSHSGSVNNKIIIINKLICNSTELDSHTYKHIKYKVIQLRRYVTRNVVHSLSLVIRF